MTTQCIENNSSQITQKEMLVIAFSFVFLSFMFCLDYLSEKTAAYSTQEILMCFTLVTFALLVATSLFFTYKMIIQNNYSLLLSNKILGSYYTLLTLFVLLLVLQIKLLFFL